MSYEFFAPRTEARLPLTVAVNLSGHREQYGVETTFTENVSGRGARVVSVRRWDLGDRLNIALLPGDFRATARVAYCEHLLGRGFAVGLEFLEPKGRWVLDQKPDPEKNLLG